MAPPRQPSRGPNRQTVNRGIPVEALGISLIVLPQLPRG